MSSRVARRYLRQAQLPEVGIAGQARIEAAWVRVEVDGLAAEVASRYLRGAGAQLGAEGALEGALPHAAGAPGALGLAPGPESVARGALAALTALRAILGLGGATDTLEDTSAPTPRAGGGSLPA